MLVRSLFLLSLTSSSDLRTSAAALATQDGGSDRQLLLS